MTKSTIKEKLISNVRRAVGLCVVLLLMEQWVHTRADASDRDYAAMLADGYEANFHNCNFRCEFENVKGLCPNLEDAKAARIANPAAPLRFLWIKSGDMVKFISYCPTRQPKLELGQELPTLTCLEHHGISSPTQSLKFAPLMGMANIHGKDESVGFVYEDHGTPFGSEACPTPHRLIQLFRDQGLGRVVFKKLPRDDGLLGIRVTSADARSKGLAEDIVIDPSRGFLPLEMIAFRDGKPSRIMIIKEIMQTPSGSWFPKRALNIWLPGGEGVHELTITRVTNLSFEPVDESEFKINVPRGVQISHMTGRGAYVLHKGGPIHARDLQRLNDECFRLAEVRVAETTQLRDMGFLADEPLPPRTWRRWWLILGVALAAGLLVAGMYRYRRWSRVHPQPL